MIRHALSISLLVLAYCHGFAQHADAVFLPAAQFTTGNNAAWSATAFDDRQWKTIRTGKVWQEQGFPDYHGYAWYRIHVVIPSSLQQNAVWKDSLRLYLAHVNDVDETYLNGSKIAQTGAFPEDPGGYISKWPAIREYHLATTNTAIKWDAENVIAIKVYDGGGTGGIFMGAPYLDMLERTDGLAIDVLQDSILYKGPVASVPLTIDNHFNTAFSGTLEITVRDAAGQKDIIKKVLPIPIRPFEKKTFRWNVPNKSGIVLSYAFSQARPATSSHPATADRSATVSIPYILTPPATRLPRINSASVAGTHPGSPFLFKIAATGAKPLQYQVAGLPAGLRLDAAIGMITGSLADSGDYTLQVRVSNQLGATTRTLVIKAGRDLALTPPMGWNSWNCWGINVSAEKVKSSAQALIDKGLIDYGWTYINIDDGWESPQRAADSTIVPNEKFPDMKGLGDWLHGNGLKFGIYSSPGPKTCGGFLGSYRNEQQDAISYASWGIDYLKYDWCSYDGIVRDDTSHEAYVKPYALMDLELAKQHRDIVYSLCQYGMNDVWKWGRQVNGQSWRTTEDIEDTWQSLTGIGFQQHRLYPYAGPGHWNDPDMMIVGRVGWGENLHPSRLTPDEQYTHVSLWCLLSAPLLIGCDLSRLNAFTLNLLTNAEVLAIDQDIAGRQAQRLIDRDSTQVWVKELSDGTKAIGIFNTGATYRSFNLKWAELGLKDLQRPRDLWRQQDLGTISNEYKPLLAPHGVMLIKLNSIKQ
jgi:hypothetical protein